MSIFTLSEQRKIAEEILTLISIEDDNEDEIIKRLENPEYDYFINDYVNQVYGDREETS